MLRRHASMSSVDRHGLAVWPALAIAAVLLAACAAPRSGAPLRHYAAPSGAPTARLLTRGAVTVGDTYGVFVLDDASRCTGPRLAGGVGVPTRAPNAAEIEAGRLATIDFLVARPDKKVCLVRWSFTPSAGKTYLVAGAMTATGCSARVLDATDPDRVRPEASAQRRNSGGSTCSPLVANPSTTADGHDQAGEAVLRPGAGADDLQGLIRP